MWWLFFVSNVLCGIWNWNVVASDYSDHLKLSALLVNAAASGLLIGVRIMED